MSPHPSDGPASPRRAIHSNQQTASAQAIPRQLPRYRVVLLNNVQSDMMFIVRTIMELTRYCRAEATHRMWEAHHRGRSQILITHRERAELYVEQFAGRDLAVIIEAV
jgi:ATP-dependent Clp protease adaptor protein ClpS